MRPGCAPRRLPARKGSAAEAKSVRRNIRLKVAELFPRANFPGFVGRNYANDVPQQDDNNQLKKAGAPPASGHSARTVCDAQRALDKLGYDMPIADCIDGKGQF